MPYDNHLPQQFVDLWNRGSDGVPAHHPAAAWDFIYNHILYLYEVLYPVMAKWVPLGDRKRMEGAVNQLKDILSDNYINRESTMMMPITRDLSAGKRWILQQWCELVSSNYQPVDLKPWS